ncbi:MAG TPA: Gfo/Idh/MocA family oxidoreductase [Planctomycetota bacterium]|nr:Gfo/Idh/MocA family oxidoreductase [Planctomycetota bacterium]
MKKIRIGIIGTGSIANNVHIPGYLRLKDEGVELAALCDIKPQALTDTLALHNLDLPTYGNFRTMLRREKLDAVGVCTPNNVHAPATIAALNAGCHVLCEKPIAKTAAEAKRMVDAAKKHRRKLQIGQHQRFQVKAQAVKRVVDAGYLGDIYYARAHALRRRGIPGWGNFISKDVQGGGPLVDIGVHILDLTLYLMGFPKPVTVAGCAYTKFGRKKGVLGLMGQWDVKKYTVEDFAAGFIRFANGATLTIEASFAANIADDQFDAWLLGTKGGVDVFKPAVYTEEAGSLWDLTPYGLPEPRIKHPAHCREIELFIEALRKNRPVPVPGEECLITQKILDGIYKSAETGREVRIR